MKLWLLRPIETLEENDNPWEPWFNKAFGFVVRAETEVEARTIAQAEAGDERYKANRPWMDAKYSTCVELVAEGAAGLVMLDFMRA